MNSSDTCRIEFADLDRVLEFAAYRWPAPGLDPLAWPTAAGSVARDATSRAGMLHFAPGRWLLPNPSSDMEQRLERAAHTGHGTKVDVTGKWAHISITGPGSARLLACAIELKSILDGRDCAAVALFDCPAVIARGNDGFELWLHSSYAVDFLATAGRFRATLQHSHG